ncbi:hypothetical protein B0H11DRAFT_2310289 [Mycena galericulata]|nr:hypothetical protein B0H11DRAFT_2310289 [Mycena galericulata]
MSFNLTLGQIYSQTELLGPTASDWVATSSSSSELGRAGNFEHYTIPDGELGHLRVNAHHARPFLIHQRLASLSYSCAVVPHTVIEVDSDGPSSSSTNLKGKSSGTAVPSRMYEAPQPPRTLGRSRGNGKIPLLGRSGEMFMTVFDYSKGHVGIDVRPVADCPAVQIRGVAGREWAEDLSRAARSNGKTEIHWSVSLLDDFLAAYPTIEEVTISHGIPRWELRDGILHVKDGFHKEFLGDVEGVLLKLYVSVGDSPFILYIRTHMPTLHDAGRLVVEIFLVAEKSRLDSAPRPIQARGLRSLRPRRTYALLALLLRIGIAPAAAHRLAAPVDTRTSVPTRGLRQLKALGVNHALRTSSGNLFKANSIKLLKLSSSVRLKLFRLRSISADAGDCQAPESAGLQRRGRHHVTNPTNFGRHRPGVNIDRWLPPQRNKGAARAYKSVHNAKLHLNAHSSASLPGYTFIGGRKHDQLAPVSNFHCPSNKCELRKRFWVDLAACG